MRAGGLEPENRQNIPSKISCVGICWRKTVRRNPTKTFKKHWLFVWPFFDPVFQNCPHFAPIFFWSSLASPGQPQLYSSGPPGQQASWELVTRKKKCRLARPSPRGRHRVTSGVGKPTNHMVFRIPIQPWTAPPPRRGDFGHSSNNFFSRRRKRWNPPRSDFKRLPEFPHTRGYLPLDSAVVRTRNPIEIRPANLKSTLQPTPKVPRHSSVWQKNGTRTS